MLQDSNTGKMPEVSRPDIENAAVQAAGAVTGKAAEKAGGKVQKAAKAVSGASAYAGVSQRAIDALFRQQNSGQPRPANGAEAAPYSKQTSTAQAIAASELFGASHLVRLTIFVEGKEIPHYKDFQLSQTTAGHHSFSLVLDHDVLGTPQNHDMEDARQMLGKSIMVTFGYKDMPEGGPERNFIGVITNVGFIRQHGNKGNIVLKGNSPTILLDGAPHIQSFGGKQVISLYSIADRVLQEGLGSKYKYRIEPGFTNNISYSCQYDETHYNYLARTAESYGEQFYYDGRKVHFGKLPPPEEAISLTFGRDVEEIDIQLRTRHVSRLLYGYNSSTHQQLNAGETKIEHRSSLAKSAYGSSEKTFKTPSLRIAPMKAGSPKDVEAAQKSAMGSEAAGVFVTTGKTSVPFLYPGCTVQLYMRKPGSAEADYMTKLMITDVHHSVDARGSYTGYFEAIAEGTGYLPAPVFHTPVAEPQVAVVTDNKDPAGQGRVQVRFDWQAGVSVSEWIRVMSPDAGGSEKVSKNRGFMAIPEVGDQVMIGFVFNHPDRPYVMGGMYHGKVGGGGGAGNNIKSLSSKSGHIIELNDGGGITIKDKDQNFVHLDGAGNIEVNSKVSIKLSCNEKCSITLDEEGNITLTGKNVYAVGSESVSMGSGSGEGDAFSGSGFSLDPNEVNIGAKTDCKISGTSNVIIGSKTIQVQASGGETSISGSKVNIN